MRKFRPHPNPPLLSESKGGGNNLRALIRPLIIASPPPVQETGLLLGLRPKAVAD